MDIEKYKTIQTELASLIYLENRFQNIKLCAGVDVAYLSRTEIEWGICCIVVIDYATKTVVEKASSIGKITVPYIPGYLAFRELPLVIEAANKLSTDPDLFIFDGNGYLHPRHMGIATHASFYLNKPTIGVAKSYFNIDGLDFTMPENVSGSYEDIIIRNEIYGRVLRSHENVKPIYISCGNYIDLQTTTEITINLINRESRIPIPVRLADLETKHIRGQL
jgi:deoxyribonuclease V